MKNSWKRFLAFTFALCVLTSSVPLKASVVSFAEDAEAIVDSTENAETVVESEDTSMTGNQSVMETDEMSIESVQSESNIIEGVFGDDITYKLNKDTGELVISGTGDMKVPENLNSIRPFYSYSDVITSVVFEEGIASICDYALNECENLTSVSFPSTLTKIGKCAFENCNSLQSIEISDSVQEIGERAFRDCTSITSLVISDSVETIGDMAFANCTAITEISIPPSVKTIGDLAFNSCSGLETVIFSEGLTYIGNNAFANCNALMNVNIPLSIEEIGSDAFANTPFDAASKSEEWLITENGVLYGYNGTETDIVIPDGVES